MNDLFPAKIIHLDLAKGLSGEILDTGGSAAYIVFWWRGIPLGHRHLRRDALPIPLGHLWDLALQTVAPAVGGYVDNRGFAAPLPEYPLAHEPCASPDLQALIALNNPMEALDAPLSAASGRGISVIVCTRDRPEDLNRCLLSLLRCSRLPAEILVIDNCPSGDATRRVVERYPQVRYVLEPKPGLDFARNTGIRQSIGQIVAFVDDDVAVHEDWVARLADCFSDPQVVAATGLILPAELMTEAQALFEQYWGFNRGYHVLTFGPEYFEKLKPLGVPAWHVGAGANMAFRREAFERVGDFDVRLDVGAAGCSGDSEFWYRLLAAGLICRYDPRIAAFHYHRKEMTALRRQLYYYMRGHTAALLVQFARHKHWGNLFRLCFLLPAHYGKLIFQGLRRGFQPRHRSIPVEWAGCLSGLFFILCRMRLGKARWTGGPHRPNVDRSDWSVRSLRRG